MRSVRFAVLTIGVAALASCGRSSSGGAGSGPTPMAAPARPAAVTPEAIALGDSLFNNGNCRNCHGMGGVGGNSGPPLNDKTWLQMSGTYDEIVAVITNGVPVAQIKDPKHTRAMGARGGPRNLNDAQVRSLAAYVWSLSNK